jgi:subtilisin family serine protease
MNVKHQISFLALAALVAVGCSQKDDFSDPSSTAQASIKPGTASYMPNELLVKFKEGSTLKSRTDILQQYGAVLVEKIATPTTLKSGGDATVYLYSIKGDVLTAAAKLSQAAEVEYAEPNYIYTTQATANDPYFTNGSLWGMYGDASSPANQYGSQASEAWALGHTGASTVYVGIIDEGYMYTHADIAANAGKNPGEIAGNRKDDDGNGYIDDVYGWDFDGRNNSIYDGTFDDHGTHVAGTIGAVGGNGIGVAGVCWNVKLIGCKFLGMFGGTTANAVKAINYLVDLKTRHNLNLVAINNSWGGGGYSQTLKDAIERANTASIIFVVAAGNGGNDGVGDNNDTTPSYPASYDCANIIAVASITSTGARSSFSNYGATSVDIGAPGSSIYSCIPKSGNKSGYGTMSGTSMATPHVTGAAALYASTHPGATMAQIKNGILSSAVATTSLSGKCTTGGRLNVSGY